MIGNISKSKGFKGDSGKNFTYEDFTPEQLADLRDGVIGVLDPDGIFEKIESIPVEPGGVNRKTGVPEERDDAIRSIDYLEVTPEKTMFFTSSLPIEDDGSVRVCIYDSNYTFVEMVHVALETDFTVESIVSTKSLESLGITASELKYLKFYRSDTNDATVEMYLVTRAIKPEFKKIYFADHGYAMYGSEIDNETMHKFVVEALGKDGNEYNIFEIKAPKNAPGEASLALMNKGDGTLQFVDFSSLTYDEDNPTVEIVCQTRGDHKLPKFSIRYNDGKGAGRVKKFTVNPDCIPVELTSEGIKVRRNNNYDNNATEEELVTVNLADMYDTVKKLKSMLPRKVTVNLPASEWVEDDDGDYSQVVSIENTPSRFEVDLQPTKEQLAIFREKEITFWVEVENGVVTVFCMGQKPTNDYVFQAKVTGVLIDE